MGPEAAREEDRGIGLLDEHQLAREEVAEGQELRVFADDLVRRLLEGEPDVHSEAALPSRPFLAGMHDAAPGTRDHHVALLRDAAGELEGGTAGRRVRARTGRAEHAHLADPAVGGEHLEGVAQLPERSVQQLHIPEPRAVAQELERRLDHLAHEPLLGRELPVALQSGQELRQQVLASADPRGLFR
jgi:hypothetical protein